MLPPPPLPPQVHLKPRHVQSWRTVVLQHHRLSWPPLGGSSVPRAWPTPSGGFPKVLRSPIRAFIVRYRVMVQTGRARLVGNMGFIGWLCLRAPLWVVVHVCSIMPNTRPAWARCPDDFGPPPTVMFGMSL